MSDKEGEDDGKAFAGRWTLEEEAYTDALIHEFRAGTLEGVEEGATLRNFLADAVGCHAKRISKKYEGTEYNGRQQFWRNIQAVSPEETMERRKKLEELKRKFEESRAQSIERATRLKTKKRLRPTFIPPKPNKKSSRPRKKVKSPDSGPVPAKATSKPDPAKEKEASAAAPATAGPNPATAGGKEAALPPPHEQVPNQALLASQLMAVNAGRMPAASGAPTAPSFMNLGANTDSLSTNGMGFGSLAPAAALPPGHLYGNQFEQGLLNPLLSQQGQFSLANPSSLLLGLNPQGQLGLGCNMFRNFNPDVLQNARAMAEENRKRQLLLDALSLAKSPPSSRSGQDP